MRHACKQTLAVGEALRARDFRKGLELRGSEFVEAYRTFRTIARAEPRTQTAEGASVRLSGRAQETTAGPVVPLSDAAAFVRAGAGVGAGAQSIRLAIVHVGAPGGGVNSATRTAARLALSRGHTVLAYGGARTPLRRAEAHGERGKVCMQGACASRGSVHNGFDGLLQGQLEELDWMSVDEWAAKGGSKLGALPGGRARRAAAVAHPAGRPAWGPFRAHRHGTDAPEQTGVLAGPSSGIGHVVGNV